MNIVLLESLSIKDSLLKSYSAALENKGHILSVFQKTEDIETLIREGENADAVILANMPLPAQVIEAWTSVRYIDIAFTGVDHVAVKKAKEKGILLSNASGYSTEAVAELTIGQMISLSRRVKQAEARCREGKDKTGLAGAELMGKTVGIIGYGKIGRRVAELCAAFKMKIIANTATRQAGEEGHVRFLPLSELLSASDIVTLHCPLTDKTRGLISESALRLMKESAVLINMARGPVVDTAALTAALAEGRINGAATDVYDAEPPLPQNHPFLSAPNLLLTPHIAFASQESMELRAKIVFENLFAWLEGRHINII